MPLRAMQQTFIFVGNSKATIELLPLLLIYANSLPNFTVIPRMPLSRTIMLDVAPITLTGSSVFLIKYVKSSISHGLNNTSARPPTFNPYYYPQI